MNKALLLSGILLVVCLNAIAQKEGQQLADSLELVLGRKNISETERVDVLAKMSYEYRNLLPRKAIAFGEQAEKLAKEIHYEKKLGEIYLYRSFAYSFFNDIIKSYEYALLGLKFNIDYKVNDQNPFLLRMDIHAGPVVAEIVGVKKFAYDIWGDTVNLAARMEQNSDARKINISGSTYEMVKAKFTCAHRGKIQAKNKGENDMYFVEAEL